MLDLNLIKTKPEYVSAALKKKGWDVDFTSTIEKMDKRLELIQKVEVVKAEINKLSASVPVVKKNGGDVQEIFAKVKDLKAQNAKNEEDLANLEKEIKEFYLLLNDADSMKLDICYLRAIVKNQKLKEVIKIINKNYNFVRIPKYFAFYNIDLSPYFESQKFLFTDKYKEALLEEIKSFFLVRVNRIYN